MIDIIEEYEKCDWCEDSIKNIGPSVAGFLFHLYDTYLCCNPECGHEMEFMPMKYDSEHYICIELEYDPEQYVNIPWSMNDGI
jgi:hypothetical protein